jgi:hypothetical protein
MSKIAEELSIVAQIPKRQLERLGMIERMTEPEKERFLQSLHHRYSKENIAFAFAQLGLDVFFELRMLKKIAGSTKQIGPGVRIKAIAMIQMIRNSVLGPGHAGGERLPLPGEGGGGKRGGGSDSAGIPDESADDWGGDEDGSG